MGAQLNSGVGNNAGMGGGKSMGQQNQLQDQINATGGGFFKPQGPQMGFGMDPNTGLPFGGQPGPGGIPGVTTGDLVNRGANQIGQQIGIQPGGPGMIGQVLGGIGGYFNPQTGGPDPIPGMPSQGMGGGKAFPASTFPEFNQQIGFGFNPETGLPNTGMGGIGGIGYTGSSFDPSKPQGMAVPGFAENQSGVNMLAQGFGNQPQMGGGPTPQDAFNQYSNAVFGLPGAQNYNRQSPILPVAQPVANRFAPPNAPGVRRAPAVSATNRANPRMMAPKPVSRNRLR